MALGRSESLPCLYLNSLEIKRQVKPSNGYRGRDMIRQAFLETAQTTHLVAEIPACQKKIVIHLLNKNAGRFLAGVFDKILCCFSCFRKAV